MHAVLFVNAMLAFSENLFLVLNIEFVIFLLSKNVHHTANLIECHQMILQ